MLRNISPLLDLCESKKVRIEIERGEDGLFNVLVQNMVALDNKEKDEAVKILKPAISTPLLLKGSLEQLESGLPAALQEFVQAMQELTTDLQCNLDAIKDQAEKAKSKAASAASKRTKKPAVKTPIGGAANKAPSTSSNDKAESKEPEKVQEETKPTPIPPAAGDLF